MKAFAALALIIGACAKVPSPSSPAGKVGNNKPPTLDPKSYPYAPPAAQPSLYSQGVLGKPTQAPPEAGLKEWLGGDFQSPQATPTLYSQGIMGKPAEKPPMKIGKGLIGEGALLGGPYKPPVAKPSLYSQGVGKSGRGWSYVVGGPFESPKPSEETYTGTVATRDPRMDIWVNLLWGGPYKQPSPGYGDPAVLPTVAPAEEALEEPVLDEPAAGDAEATATLAEDVEGPSVLAISFWAAFGVVLGSSSTIVALRFLRRDLPAEGQEPLMTV